MEKFFFIKGVTTKFNDLDNDTLKDNFMRDGVCADGERRLH